jgi:putative DNA primase/helicase
MERPELRKFDFDPVERAKENRPKLVAAALTIMLAFKAAGSPQQATPLGSFEDWSSTVRDALIWLGRADPVETMEYVRATDTKLDDLASVLTLWRAKIGPMERITCRRLIERSSHSGNEELADALVAVAGQRGGAISAKRLGKWLAQNAQRICNGMWVETCGLESGVTLWRLCAAPTPGG